MKTIQLVDEIPSNVEEKMQEDLVKYESSHGIDVNYKHTKGPFWLNLNRQD